MRRAIIEIYLDELAAPINKIQKLFIQNNNIPIESQDIVSSFDAEGVMYTGNYIKLTISNLNIYSLKNMVSLKKGKFVVGGKKIELDFIPKMDTLQFID